LILIRTNSIFINFNNLDYALKQLWAHLLLEVYLRITVDGIAKETFTKPRWWDQKTERPISNKKDARALNFFL